MDVQDELGKHHPLLLLQAVADEEDAIPMRQGKSADLEEPPLGLPRQLRKADVQQPLRPGARARGGAEGRALGLKLAGALERDFVGQVIEHGRQAPRPVSEQRHQHQTRGALLPKPARVGLTAM